MAASRTGCRRRPSPGGRPASAATNLPGADQFEQDDFRLGVGARPAGRQMAASTSGPGRCLQPVLGDLRPRPRRPGRHRAGSPRPRRRRAWPARRSPPRGPPANRSCWPPRITDSGGRVLAIAHGPQQQCLPLGRQLLQFGGQRRGHFGAGHFAGHGQADVEEVLVRRANLRQAAGPSPRRLAAAGTARARAATLMCLGRSLSFARSDALPSADGVQRASRLRLAGGRKPLGTGEAGVGSGKSCTGESLPQRPSAALRRPRACRSGPGPGGGRSHGGPCRSRSFAKQFNGLGVLALADRVDHADQLPAVEFRGGVAQRLVDRRIGNAFQPEAGVARSASRRAAGRPGRERRPSCPPRPAAGTPWPSRTSWRWDS